MKKMLFGRPAYSIALLLAPIVLVLGFILVAILQGEAVLYRVDNQESVAVIIDKYGVIQSPVFQEADDTYERLIAVKKKGQWGFFDIETKEERYFGYTRTYSYSDGLALVYNYPNYFFIDRDNKPVTGNLAYDSFGYFSEGLCSVARRESGVFKYGFIDVSGKVVIPLQYDAVKPFKNNETYVMKGKEWFRLDKRGNVVQKYPYHASLHVSDDGKVLTFISYMSNAAIYVDEVGNQLDIPRMYASGNANNNRIPTRDSVFLKYGYRNYIGDWGIFPLYEAAGNFSNERAFVVYDANVYLIDTHNTIIADLGAGVSSTSQFYTDYATIRKPYTHQYMNETGKIVVHEKMIIAPKVVTNTVPVVFADGVMGTVGASGRLKKYPAYTGVAAIALRKQNYTIFSSKNGYQISKTHLPSGKFESVTALFPLAGLRVVYNGGKYEIKNNNNRVIETNIDALIINPFIDSPAIIGVKTNTAHYITSQTSLPLKETSVVMPVSENGYVGALKNGHWGALNNKGAWALPPVYAGISYFSEGFAAVMDKDTRLWHYITPSGRELFKKMPVDVSAASPFVNGVAMIRTEKGMHYLSKSGNFWRPKDDFSILLPHTYKLGSYFSGHGPTYIDKNGNPISIQD